MKKTTLVAMSALFALAANAEDFTCDPSNELLFDKNVSTVYSIVLADPAQDHFKANGAAVEYIGPDADNGRNFWWWAGWTGGDDSNPRVDFEEGGYISLEVTGTAGWSGGGLNVAKDKTLDISKINDETHFHLAYMTPGTAPASIALILLDGENDCGSKPAKMALGDAFNDNGAIFPAVGPKATNEWQGVDITVAQIKKIWPTFAPASLNAWCGNLFSILSGNVAGTSFAFDAMYFYNLGTNGINNIANDTVDFNVTANTVNALGGNGIELYNLAGQLVKKTNGSTLGLNNLQKGIYVAKSGSKAQKVVVR